MLNEVYILHGRNAFHFHLLISSGKVSGAIGEKNPPPHSLFAYFEAVATTHFPFPPPPVCAEVGSSSSR